MYRKLFHIILGLIFLGTTTGINISKHFCEGKLIAVSLSSNHLSCCSEGEENCCSIHSDWIHLALKFVPAKNNIPTDNVDIGFSSSFFFVNLVKEEHLELFTKKIFQIQYPPPLRLSKILAKHQSYLL